jgi:hypothetical protein
VGGTSDGDIDGKAEREAPQNAESASKTHWCEEEKREPERWGGRGLSFVSQTRQPWQLEVQESAMEKGRDSKSQGGMLREDRHMPLCCVMKRA